jgi:hypothetical protein
MKRVVFAHQCERTSIDAVDVKGAPRSWLRKNWIPEVDRRAITCLAVMSKIQQTVHGGEILESG